MIRRLYIKGEQINIFKVLKHFKDRNIPEQDYQLKGDNDTIYLRLYLLEEIDLELFGVFVGYASAFTLPSISYRNVFRELSINGGKKIVIERSNYMKPKELTKREIQLFVGLFVKNQDSEKDYRHIDTILEKSSLKCPANDNLQFITEAYECERLRWGLLDYY